jgi:hypothetical protein
MKVVSVVGRIPAKFSAADPIPSSVLKPVVHIVMPFIASRLAGGQFRLGLCCLQKDIIDCSNSGVRNVPL